MANIEVLVTVYFPRPEGGWVPLWDGRMTVATICDINLRIACKALHEFAQTYVARHPETPKPYDPERVVVCGVFDNLGALYVNGCGEQQEMTPR